MKKLLLILLCLPMIGFGQCTSGDCFNGYGVFTSEEGTYKGNWKDAKPHGIGMFVGLEYTYDGEYVNGKKHGQGKMTYTNGMIDEGKFISGEFVFVKKTIGCISGNCENDWGVHKWSDGSSYTGYWKYGVKHGEGTFINKWGGKYVGEWKNGKEHGQGTKTFSYGTVERGKWINGVYQKPKTTKKKTVKPKITPARTSSSYSSYTEHILSYDFNNSPFNIRYSTNMVEDEKGFYIGGGFKTGRTPTSSGIYEVENAQPIMYDGDATIGSFGPKIEESQSSYYIDAGITRHLFYAFWWSAGLAYERNLIVEKREHFFDHDNNGSNLADEYWGIEWLENKDESYHKVFIETDVYLKILDVIVVKYGISYKNAAINSVVGVGVAF
jgi:hypothetical protein